MRLKCRVTVGKFCALEGTDPQTLLFFVPCMCVIVLSFPLSLDDISVVPGKVGWSETCMWGDITLGGPQTGRGGSSSDQTYCKEDGSSAVS